jgi:hypothetical protein
MENGMRFTVQLDDHDDKLRLIPMSDLKELSTAELCERLHQDDELGLFPITSALMNEAARRLSAFRILDSIDVAKVAYWIEVYIKNDERKHSTPPEMYKIRDFLYSIDPEWREPEGK